MIRYTLACISGLCLLTGPAWAHAPGEWSVGAGLGAGFFLDPAPVQLSPVGALPVASLPAAQVNVEKKIGPRVSLMLGVLGSFQDSSLDAQPDLAVRSSSRRGSAGASAGMRFRVTGDDAPVDVSVFGALNVGYAAVSEERVAIDPPSAGGAADASYVSDIIGGGLNAGFSVERMLVDRLSVRLNASVFQATYSDLEMRLSSTSLPTDTLDGGAVFNANLLIRPGIELRMYF
ncbi:MAG: hypothetical protein WBV82_06740 [Myxococcaceae bacterium]